VQISETAGTFPTSAFSQTWSKQCDLPIAYD